MTRRGESRERYQLITLRCRDVRFVPPGRHANTVRPVDDACLRRASFPPPPPGRKRLKLRASAENPRGARPTFFVQKCRTASDTTADQKHAGDVRDDANPEDARSRSRPRDDDDKSDVYVAPRPTGAGSRDPSAAERRPRPREKWAFTAAAVETSRT
ncbi:hypothetical protein PUN28_002372 [Cardiocondyla obscurior]|uniref:Uncharacterized protein n=1 Tax=Cardiocondyla obscurior TaxID=286306 RepID=A0AAW2GTX7_9HYME